jgi:uncharacterized protein YjbI with pentapeptide repeats
VTCSPRANIGAEMAPSTPARPRRDRLAADPPYAADVPTELTPLDADAALQPDEPSWSGVALDDAQFGGLERTGLSIVGSRLERVDLAAARLPSLRMVDAVLHGCNLANVQARGASLVRCELRGCRLTGSSWTEGRLTDVLVKDCRVDLAAFTSTTLERVTFESCRMTQSDLQDVGCESVRFLSCDLGECDLTDARFRRSELRGCELGGLHGVERLHGVGIEFGDLLELAPALAAALGIRLLDAGEDA